MLTIVIFGLLLVGNVQVNAVQAYVGVSGIITSDTTWTKVNSPYNLTGNLAIDKGVILTIEPGVIVNLNKYYILVNGTLAARGTSIDNIHLNAATDGYIEYTSSSTGWNSQTGTGSIIENAVVNSVIRTTEVSILINNNTITKSLSLAGGSPIVSKNSIAIVTGSDWLGRPVYPSVGISISDVFYLSNENTALIVDNTISGDFERAAVEVGSGSPIIQRNLISNSYGYGGDSGFWQAGIMISGDSSPIIKQNTITQCANGIHISGSPAPTIVNNNIENITSFNIDMKSRTVNIDVANNWWGTTDAAVIGQKIWDFDDDFDLGKVNYTPFLTEANPQAMPNPNAPTPTTAPTQTVSQTQNPTASPTQIGTPDAGQSELYPVVVVGLAGAVAVLAVAVVVLLRRKPML